MTAPYLLIFAFGFLLLGAWAGWGAALARLLLRPPEDDRALHTAWGLAWTCVVGGVLNLGRWITPRSVHLFLATGLVLLTWSCLTRGCVIRSGWRDWWARTRQRRTLWLSAVVLAAMLLSAYSAALCSKSFNVHDDLQAYLVFPQKMIQTGQMGPDPFSERRIVSLGAMSFLHAIVLSVADTRYLGVVDPGVSLVLGVALILAVSRRARAGPWTAVLAVFCFVAVPPPQVNVTSLVSGFALFLALFATLSRVALRGRPGAGGAVLVALVASALCSLKTTFVVPCALMVLGAYLLKSFRSRSPRAAFEGLVLVGLVTLLFMGPWMISLHQSSGTLLFPVFGRGFHGSAYGGPWRIDAGLGVARWAAAVGSTVTDLRVVPVWLLGLALLVRGRLGVARGVVSALIGAAFVGYVVLTAVHEGPAYRYSWPFLYASLVTLLIYSARDIRARGPRTSSAALAGSSLLLAVAVLAVAHSAEARSYWERQRWSIGVALTHARAPGFKTGAAQRYGQMARAIPPGATVLTRLQFPFLLDFRDHTFLIADYPGGASPPPGMPFGAGGERLAEYLCAQGVEYVAYSYRQQGAFSREQYSHRLGPDSHPWNRAQAMGTFDFQDNLVELGQTRYRVYDDGDVFVLDLGAAPDGRSLGCRPS